MKNKILLAGSSVYLVSRYMGSEWFEFRLVAGMYIGERLDKSYIQDHVKLTELLDEVYGKEQYSIFEATDLLGLSMNIKKHVQKSL